MEELACSVGSNYVIVRSIMGSMAWRDVHLAEKVCRLWADVARELRKTELRPHHFNYAYGKSGLTQSPHPAHARFYEGLGCFGEPELLVSFHQLRVSYGPVRCPLYSCPKRFTRDVGVCVEKPPFEHHCIFCGKNTKVILVRSTRVFCIRPQIKENIDSFMTGIAIPKISGINVHNLFVTEDEYSDPSVFNSVLSEIMNSDIIKCFLIFLTDVECEEQEDYIKQLIANAKKRQETTHPSYRFAVCGGITKSSYNLDDESKESEKHTIKIVVFSVNKSDVENVEFNAYSSIFADYSPVMSKSIASFRNQMKMMADVIPLRKYGVCIKVSCFERNKIFSDENYILSEHFTNMPVIGCEANGELGVNCLPDTLNEPPNVKKRRYDSYDDCAIGYSTVLAILTWGRLM